MTLQSTILDALEEKKAVDISNLNVSSITDVTDSMIIATGNSKPHIDAIAKNVINMARNSDSKPIGVSADNEWILIDLGDVIVHVMSANARNYYQIDKFWGGNPPEQKKVAIA